MKTCNLSEDLRPVPSAGSVPSASIMQSGLVCLDDANGRRTKFVSPVILFSPMKVARAMGSGGYAAHLWGVVANEGCDCVNDLPRDVCVCAF